MESNNTQVVTRTSLLAARTCNDALALGLTERKDLCRNCCNYYDLPLKKKLQDRMDKRHYGCLNSTVNGITLSITPEEDLETNKRKRKASKDSTKENSNNSFSTPPSVGPRNNNSSTKEESITLKNTITVLLAQLKNARAENERMSEDKEKMKQEIAMLELELGNARNQAKQSQANERKSNRMLQDIIKNVYGFNPDPYITTSGLLNSLYVKKMITKKQSCMVLLKHSVKN